MSVKKQCYKNIRKTYSMNQDRQTFHDSGPECHHYIYFTSPLFQHSEKDTCCKYYLSNLLLKYFETKTCQVLSGSSLVWVSPKPLIHTIVPKLSSFVISNQLLNGMPQLSTNTSMTCFIINISLIQWSIDISFVNGEFI